MQRVMWACLLALWCGFACPPKAMAQSYPSKPIRLLVGLGAGGATDLTFRKLAELASKELGQPIVVENKPGAGGTLAPSSVARFEKPDGYTIAVATSTLLRFPLQQKVEWDPIRDFTWIAGLGSYTFVVAVKADGPLRTAADLVRYAKANPGQLTLANSGTGSTMHLLAQAFERAAGIEVTHVGFKSTNEVATNLLGGHVMAALDAPATVMPFVESGQLRLLMSFDAAPTAWMPELPTAKSLGYDLAYPAPYGLVGPKGMPADVVRKLAGAFKKAVDSPEYAKLLAELRQTYWYKGGDDYTRWASEFYASERSAVERENAGKR